MKKKYRIDILQLKKNLKGNPVVRGKEIITNGISGRPELSILGDILFDILIRKEYIDYSDDMVVSQTFDRVIELCQTLKKII